MRTFTFTHKNTGDVFITEADDFDEAEVILKNTLIDTYGWRVDDEEGEDENALFI